MAPALAMSAAQADSPHHFAIELVRPRLYARYGVRADSNASMPSGNRAFKFVVAALLVVFGVGQVRASKERPAESSSAVAPSQVLDDAPQPPEQLAEVGADRACGGGRALLESYRALYRDTDAPGTFRFLVALVPDPEESGHTDYFDAVLEGVEEAVAAGIRDFWKKDSGVTDRYVRDRHFFPWPGSNAEKRKLGCWQTTPGVVLYRPLADPTRTPALAVLLVGETPTWGVREKQLATALRWVDDERLGEAAVPTNGGTSREEQPGKAMTPASDSMLRRTRTRWYRILGPTFSGSAPSLAAAIRKHVRRLRQSGRDPDVELSFRVASGTATGVGVEPMLEGAWAREAGLRVKYESAMPSDEALLQAMVAFLESTSGGSSRPARDSVVLSESMTAYGEGISQRKGLPQLKFPPNLASLRRAYMEVARNENGDLSAPRAPSDAKTQPEERRGELSEQTPISHDLALAEVLRELNHRRYRNVGIVATDARDVVFMAERIKSQLPDVRLFTIGFDIRYLHPDHARFLNGMLVAHAASESSLGPSMVLENPMTRSVSEAGRFLLAGTPLEPTARVSLVGNGVLWQLGPDTPPRSTPGRLDIPYSFRLVYWASLGVFGAILLLVAGPSLVLGLARLGARGGLPEVVRRSGFLRQRTPFWSALGNCEHIDLAADHAFATASLLTIALSVPVLIAAAAFRLSGTARGTLTIVAFSLLVLGLIWWKVRGHVRAASRSALLLGILVSIVALFATALGCSTPRAATFNLLSGGSPLIGGLLGLGMLLVAVWCWRARVRSLDTLRFGALPGAHFFSSMKLPIAQTLGKAEHSEIGELERRLHKVIRSPWSSAPFIPLLIQILLFLSIGFVLVTKPVLTFEVGFRHWVLIGFVVACIVPITTSFARILVAARSMRRLLRSVACIPLEGGFEKLPPELSRRLEIQLASGGREVGELTHPVGALARLGTVVPELAPVGTECARQLEDELAYEAGAPEPEPEPKRSFHGPAELVDRLLQTASTLPGAPASEPARALVVRYRACLVAIFVARYVRHLRLLVPPVLVGSILAVLMTSLYFVQPQHLISSVCFVWVTGMALGIVLVYLGLARDPLISAIGQTTAGSVTPSWNLISRVLALTLVPLASFVASQYPEFAFWVSSALGSAARVFQ